MKIQKYLSLKVKRSAKICFFSLPVVAISMFAILSNLELKNGFWGVLFVISTTFLMISTQVFHKIVSFDVDDIIIDPKDRSEWIVSDFNHKKEMVQLKSQNETKKR